VDRATDLTLNPPVADLGRGLVCLRPLDLSEGEKLYKLVQEVDSVGHRWLYPARRGQFVWSPNERFSRRIESFFSGEAKTHWGAFSGSELDVGLVLHTTHGLNRKAHRFRLWTRPGLSQPNHSQVAQDILVILSKKAKRPVRVSLSTCESQMIDALVRHGFHRMRTLILMKLDL
jgi:hypothetical protein